MTALERQGAAAPTVRFVQTGAVRWCVTERGDGPAVLLLHGTGSSAESFDALTERLAAEGFRTIAPDLPGHARTRVGPTFAADLASMAASTAELLERLEVTPRAVIGHSAGAAILARMALDELVSPSLFVALAPALSPLPGLAGLGFPVAARLLASTPLAARVIAASATDESVERMIDQTGSRLPAPALARYQRLSRQPTHVAGVLAMLSAWELSQLDADLPRLTTPALLLAGADDAAIAPAQQRAMATRLPNASFMCLDEVGHLLHEERPAAVFNAMAPALLAAGRTVAVA
ncbi:MAG: alpha/beta fold hydrolase [Myxococcaceae bacterium]|jgi:magnesium chelatase accessory protein|nr:alpha/beta fold hydrolase [Myxococcaceae bacterium]